MLEPIFTRVLKLPTTTASVITTGAIIEFLGGDIG